MSDVFRFLEVQRTDTGKEPVFVRFGQFGQFHGDHEQREGADEDALSLRIRNPEIFAGGDMAGAFDHVVNAIYSGRQAVRGILYHTEA